MKTKRAGLVLCISRVALLVLAAGCSEGSHSSAGGRSGVVATGGFHTCALENGGVKCWGSNNYGQLGDGTTTFSSVPVQVSGLKTDVDSIAAGSLHTCALVHGGVKCWGSNFFGQLGNETPGSSNVPVQVQDHDQTGDLSGVEAITAGGHHTCALVNGSVECWGDNGSGQLGKETPGTSSVPVHVQNQDGTGDLSGVEAVAAGGRHTCGLVNGGVWCWGRNSDGQLGKAAVQIGVTSAVPVRVQSWSDAHATVDLTDVRAITAGGFHSCGTLAQGGVRCWGAGARGQLGSSMSIDGETAALPVKVLASEDPTVLTSRVDALAAGAAHTCALTGGKVLCWGDNHVGQLGPSALSYSFTTFAVEVPGLSGVKTIAAGGVPNDPAHPGIAHTCAFADSVKCWGSNSSGQLGDGTTSDSSTPVP
jgi:alpha-tubulin suppressor-like RCC1 family protein